MNVNGANMRGLTTEQVSEGSILPNMIFVNSTKSNTNFFETLIKFSLIETLPGQEVKQFYTSTACGACDKYHVCILLSSSNVLQCTSFQAKAVMGSAGQILELIVSREGKREEEEEEEEGRWEKRKAGRRGKAGRGKEDCSGEQEGGVFGSMGNLPSKENLGGTLPRGIQGRSAKANENLCPTKNNEKSCFAQKNVATERTILESGGHQVPFSSTPSFCNLINLPAHLSAAASISTFSTSCQLDVRSRSLFHSHFLSSQFHSHFLSSLFHLHFLNSLFHSHFHSHLNVYNLLVRISLFHCIVPIIHGQWEQNVSDYCQR